MNITRIRIRAACGSIERQSFSYDPFGNIVPAVAVAYGGNGNVLKDGYHTYTWDAEGRNTQIYALDAVTCDALVSATSDLAGKRVYLALVDMMTVRVIC